MRRLLLLTLVLVLTINFCACAELFDAEILNPGESNNKDNFPTECNHIAITVAEVKPTCTSTGTTDYKKCSLCNELLSNPEAIEMLEHSFDPSLSSCSERKCLVCNKVIPESHEYELKRLDIDGSCEIERYGLFSCS